MKFAFPIAAISLLFHVSTSQAQELGPGNIGFARVVSAVGLETPTCVTLGSVKLLKGKPVPPGGTSGVISLVAGKTTLEVTNPACDPPELSAKIDVPGGATIGIVVYHKYKEVDGELVPELAYSRLTEASKREKPQLSVVSLSARPTIPISVGGQSVLLETRRAKKFDAERGGGLTIKYGGKEIAKPEFRQGGHYVVFIYDGATQNEVRAVEVHFMKYDANFEE